MSNENKHRPPAADRVFHLIGRLEDRLMCKVEEIDADPDFVGFARGTQALLNYETLLARRHERSQREQGARETNLNTMAPFDAASLAKLHGDAKRLRIVDARKVVAANDREPEEPGVDFEAVKAAVAEPDEGNRVPGPVPKPVPGPLSGERKPVIGQVVPKPAQKQVRGQARGQSPVSPTLPTLRRPLDD